MRVPLEQQTEAGRWRRLVDDLAGRVGQQDQSSLDLNPRPDSVLLDGRDLPDPMEFPAGARMGEFRDRLIRGEVQKSSDGQLSSATLSTRHYYDTAQYGPSVPYGMEYGFQANGQQLDYTVHREDPKREHSFDVRFRVDAQSGELLAYHRKDYAMTFPQAVKEVVTSKAGLTLVAMAGVGGALPFGLPGAIAQAALGPLGPVVSGVVCATSTVLALAKLKTRPW